MSAASVLEANWRGRRALVTGASGFLGRNLCATLLERGADVHGLVRGSTDLAPLAGLAATWHTVDLTDRDGLCELLRATGAEYVVHCAASHGHARDWPERRQALLTSALGTAALLDASHATGVARVVHVGSSTEYGPRDEALSERDRLSPAIFRGAVKASASLLAQTMAREDGLHVTVLRPFSIYGPWESPERFIPTVIASTLRGAPISLTGPGVRHDFVYVDDVVQACLLGLTADVAPGELFNVGTGVESTNEEVVGLVQALSGRATEVRMGAHPGHRPDTAHWFADTEHARAHLGWTPRHTLREGLGKTLAWMATRPPTTGS